jgi:hypothetical protein
MLFSSARGMDVAKRLRRVTCSSPSFASKERVSKDNDAIPPQQPLYF